jgi:hypothetical protein
MLIRTNENRLPAIQQAISEISKDQLLLSQTISKITDKVIDSGKGKDVMVREMLSNPVINRLALNYMGSDFSTQKSMFLAQIRHVKAVSKQQSDIARKRSNEENKVKDELKKLESKKKFLLMSRGSVVPGGYNGHQQWAAWQREMYDIDSQIYKLRDLALTQSFNKDATQNSGENIKIKQANTIFEVATEYEKNTVVRLEHAIVVRRMSYVKDEATVIMLKDRLNTLSIWPLSIFIEI